MAGKKKFSTLKGAWRSAISRHSRYTVIDFVTDVLTGGVTNLRDEADQHAHFIELLRSRPKGSRKRRK